MTVIASTSCWRSRGGASVSGRRARDRSRSPRSEIVSQRPSALISSPYDASSERTWRRRVAPRRWRQYLAESHVVEGLRRPGARPPGSSGSRRSGRRRARRSARRGRAATSCSSPPREIWKASRVPSGEGCQASSVVRPLGSSCFGSSSSASSTYSTGAPARRRGGARSSGRRARRAWRRCRRRTSAGPGSAQPEPAGQRRGVVQPELVLVACQRRARTPKRPRASGTGPRRCSRAPARRAADARRMDKTARSRSPALSLSHQHNEPAGSGLPVRRQVGPG